MEILINGSNRAISKLPTWFKPFVNALKAHSSKFTILLYRTQEARSHRYHLVNNRTRTVIYVEHLKKICRMTAYRRAEPGYRSSILPPWLKEETIDVCADAGIPVFLNFVTKYLLTDTPYSLGTIRKQLVSLYPLAHIGLYGGKVEDIIRQNGDALVTFSTGMSLHFDEVDVDKHQIEIGKYVVLRNPRLFSVMVPEVFFDYFSIA